MTRYQVTTRIFVEAEGPVNAAWAVQDKLATQFEGDPYQTFIVSDDADINPPYIIDLNDPPMCTAEAYQGPMDQQGNCEVNPTWQDDTGAWWCPKHQPQPDPDEHADCTTEVDVARPGDIPAPPFTDVAPGELAQDTWFPSRAPMVVPGLPGGRRISTAGRLMALTTLTDTIGTHLSHPEAVMCIDYVAARLERDEIDGAIGTLMSTAGVDITGAYRLIAVLETTPAVANT